eukprot:Tamp_17956.p1 GENE.Tamp_17956~~Tamp_17956.p1  ORF type:complete len:442 (+),score=119.31 Tamp_17956:60-1328(+)
MASMSAPRTPLDVRNLQQSMVKSPSSHAQAIVKRMLRFPDVDLPQSDDPHVLRSQLLQMKAKMKEYASKAEAACYEVESACKAGQQSSPVKMNAPGGAVVTGKAQPFKTSMSFEEPTPEASPIPLLEAINSLITAEEEEEGWDLLRDDMKHRATHSTVGLRLAQNSSAADLRPLQIQYVIPGSSAHICGLLSRGDEIIAVDGQQATEQRIVEQVRGTDIVGSKVVLTVRKGGVGQVFDVALVRGAWGAVERKEKLFILFEELHKLVKMEAPKEQIEAKLNAVVKEAKEYEKYRAVSEMTIHDRLHDLQTEMHRLVKSASDRTQKLLTKYTSACQTINSQMPEITIALHERVESYIKELQLRLEESETRNGKLQAKVEAAEKWMEAIKAMEALASFSRRKIRNWEGIHAAKPGVSKGSNVDDT